MKPLPLGYTLNGVIGVIVDVAQLLLDVAGLIKNRRSELERRGSPDLVLLKIHADRKSLIEQGTTEQRQRLTQNDDQASIQRRKCGSVPVRDSPRITRRPLIK